MIVNKKIIASVLAVASVLTVSAGALADDNITVTVNGNNVSFVEITPFIENDHTLVPMREIFEALGADVQWDNETRTVISYDSVSDVSITMQIDSDVMYVNGDAVTLETPAKIVGSSTVVPVRAIAEGMHSVVGWDEATKTVTVEKEIKTEPSSQIPNPWTDYNSLDELNAALNNAESVKYQVADLNASSFDEGSKCEAQSYRYLADSNLAEIKYTYNTNVLDITVRTQPGDADISGISGGTKVEDYKVADSAVEIYTYNKTTYAIWSCEDAGTVMSHSVAVTENETVTDVNALVKILVDDVETNHPRG